MGQITEEFAHAAFIVCEQGDHPSLTVWETQQLLIAWLDRQRLWAENASLRESVAAKDGEIAGLKKHDSSIINAYRKSMKQCDELAQQIVDLTQQLAAANGRVEMLRMNLHSSNEMLRGEGIYSNQVRINDATLSNPNEDSAG